ncbi:hypothetical protein N665_0472s0012 [Sinapis alba]|nr:hypothetical protein N665_0472s0012 [Sinapis alba]
MESLNGSLAPRLSTEASTDSHLSNPTLSSGLGTARPSTSSLPALPSSLAPLTPPVSSSSSLTTTSAPMDSSNGSHAGVNSLSVTSSSLASSLTSSLASSVLLKSTREISAQDCDHSSPLMEPASSIVPESSASPEINVTFGSAAQVGCTNFNSHRSVQLQNLDTKTSDIQATVFVPSLGAWGKPLLFKPPATPSVPSTPRDYDPAIVGNQLAALWPSLNDDILNKKPKSKHTSRTLQPPVEKLPLPELKADGSLRFPWAARLSPQSRNLYRAASPTYRLDGTPEISIPSKVLKLGPENKDEYIIGKFHKCSLPPGGLVHAVVNRIWGRSCKISCKKISESSFMFHIPHESTRHWVIQRGVWHIDDCLLFVLPWTPEGSFKILEISTLPVWVNLKNIPDCCYSRLGISHIASGLGEPILTHKPRLDPTSMGEAKVLIEMELDRDFPKLIALDDKQGSIFLVDVDYTWIPSMCEKCGNLGHKEKRCLLSSKPADEPILPPQTVVISSEIPVVDIDRILQQGDTSIPLSPAIPTPGHGAFVFQSINDSEGPATTDLTHALQPNVEVAQDIPSGPSDTSEVCTRNSTTLTLSSSLSQQEKPSDPHNSVITSITLVDSQSTPIDTPIMDLYPSGIINNEVQESLVVDHVTTTPKHCVFESPSQFTVLEDVDEVEIEPSSSLSLTRGGRESKPPTKYQNLEWKTVRGRGKRGRGGRGSRH